MEYTLMNSGSVGQECCEHMCRLWEEMAGGFLPASNHSPQCENYTTETFFEITPAGTHGPVCIVETQPSVNDMLDGNPSGYDVTEIQLTRDQFEHLQEFEGF